MTELQKELIDLINRHSDTQGANIYEDNFLSEFSEKFVLLERKEVDVVAPEDEEKAMKRFMTQMSFTLVVRDKEHVQSQIDLYRKENGSAGVFSDGYHTFDELYEHRIALFIALCYNIAAHLSWKSKVHSDGSVWDGWFILGINKAPGKQITYHLPMSKWDACYFAQELDKAPEFDGHTSADVLERISKL